MNGQVCRPCTTAHDYIALAIFVAEKIGARDIFVASESSSVVEVAQKMSSAVGIKTISQVLKAGRVLSDL